MEKFAKVITEYVPGFGISSMNICSMVLSVITSSPRAQRPTDPRHRRTQLKHRLVENVKGGLVTLILGKIIFISLRLAQTLVKGDDN